MRYWRRAALADGGATSDRGGDRRRRAEPNAGAGTPGVCPHRITRNTDRAQCARTADPRNKAIRRVSEPDTIFHNQAVTTTGKNLPEEAIGFRGVRCTPVR